MGRENKVMSRELGSAILSVELGANSMWWRKRNKTAVGARRGETPLLWSVINSHEVFKKEHRGEGGKGSHKRLYFWRKGRGWSI